MNQTKLTSSATLPGFVGGGGDFDGLFFFEALMDTLFLQKNKKQKKTNNNRVISITFITVVHLDPRMNGSQFLIG